MTITSFDEFLNEAVTSLPDIETANKLIDDNANAVAGIKLMAAEDDGVHIYIKHVGANKFYDEVPGNFYISYYTLKDLANTPLGNAVYVIVRTYDYKDTSKRINDMWGHAIVPIVTKQGMFFNSPKEAKDYIRQIKTGNSENTKKNKYVAATLKEYITQADELTKTYGGSTIGWKTQDMMFK